MINSNNPCIKGFFRAWLDLKLVSTSGLPRRTMISYIAPFSLSWSWNIHPGLRQTSTGVTLPSNKTGKIPLDYVSCVSEVFKRIKKKVQVHLTICASTTWSSWALCPPGHLVPLGTRYPWVLLSPRRSVPQGNETNPRNQALKSKSGFPDKRAQLSANHQDIDNRPRIRLFWPYSQQHRMPEH